MTKRFKDLGDTHLYYVVPHDDSFEDVVRRIYSSPSQALFDQMLYLNPQVRDLKVEAGQILLIPSQLSQSCTDDESMLIDMISKLDKARAQRRQEHGSAQRHVDELYAKLYNLLITSDAVGGIEQNGSAGLGAWSAYYGFRVKRAAAILEDIQREYVSTLKRTGGRLNAKALTRFRRAKFVELKQALGGFLRPVVLDRSAYSREGALGIDRADLIQSFKAAPNVTPEGFIASQSRLLKLARTVRGAGYLGIALDGAYSVHEVMKACQPGMDREGCIQTSFQQTGRFSGSVFGGAAAGEGTYLGCNAVFGIESLGTSLLFCGIPALYVSYKAGNAVGAAGKGVGNYIFETTVRVPK